MITIIVPVFNCKNYIDECVSSIINQTVKDLQIILVDDGSYDGSEKICDYYAEIDERIKVIHIKNSGVSIARNIGLANAMGEWVTFVDADDYISSDYCEALLNVTDKDIDMVIGRTISFNYLGFNDDGFNLTNDVVLDKDKSILYKSIFVDNYKENIIPHISTCSAKLIRRKLIEERSLQYKNDIKLYEDAIFNIDVIYNSRKIAVINKKIYFYRLNLDSSSNSIYQLQQYEKTYRTLEEYDNKYHINYYAYENYFKIKNLNMIFMNAANGNDLSIDFIKKSCKNDSYREALTRVNIMSLPKRRKLLVFLYRINFFSAIYFEYNILR